MNPYKKLNIPEDSEPEEIKKAYHKKAAETHPDKSGDPDEFREVALAYDILSDPLKRRRYDTEKQIHKKPQREKTAVDMILREFDTVITSHGVECDVIQEIKKKLRESLGKFPIMLHEIKEQKQKAEGLQSRIKLKDCAFPDFIGMAVTNSILDLDIHKEKVMEEHATTKLALEMIGYYSCCPSTVPCGQSMNYLGNATSFSDIFGGIYG